MDKLTLAHEWAMKHGSAMTHKTVIDAWAYADAMQAEADKRNNTERPKVLFEPKPVGEWQPDWSQAPDNAKYWAMDKDGSANFFKNKPEITNGNGWDFGGVMESNNSHSYQGNWKDSLRERPHGI